MVRMDRSEHIRSLLSVRGEDTLVRLDQEREGGKEMPFTEHLLFIPGVLYRLSYLIFKTVTIISSGIYR